MKGGTGVSVIIPTYNREQFIKETIQSVLDQNYGDNLEIILSDDGSTDNTLSVAYAFRDKIKILTKSEDCKTQGAGSSRNRGIKVSTQPFICFLDSDDIYLPGHLKKMVSACEKGPELGFAFCRSLEFKTEGNTKLFRPWTRARILQNDIKNPVVSRSGVVNTNSFIFRKEVFDSVGYFNETYSNGEDGDLWMRISEQFRGAFSDHFGVAYRTHHGLNQLTKNSKGRVQMDALNIFQDAKKRYYELRLRDRNRIFRIKHKLLWCRYRLINPVRSIYYLKYVALAFQYPQAFIKFLIETRYEKKEQTKLKSWNQLDYYLK